MELPLSFLYSPKLSHFVCVYAHHNLRVAAELLQISQPALTKSLKSLEEQLGTSLFTRSKKGMEPTEAAAILFAHTKKLQDLSRMTEVALSAHNDGGEGLIRIGAGQMWSWLFIPDIVSKFKESFPATNLEITTGPMPDLVEQLVSKHLDIVVGDFHGIKVSMPFELERIWSSEFGAFAGTAHELASKENVELGELVQFSWSGFIDHDVFEQKVKAMCIRHDVARPNITIKATSLATLFRLTKDSNNILVLPKELEAEAARADLVPIRSNKLSLWTIDTGSVIESGKTGIEQYKVLLSLMKAAGAQSAGFLLKD